MARTCIDQRVRFFCRPAGCSSPEGRSLRDQTTGGLRQANWRLACCHCGASWSDDVTTLDLHIGPHKTGTTSLQSFFAANDAILKQSSIVYPRTGAGKKDKHNLLRSVAEISRRSQSLACGIARRMFRFRACPRQLRRIFLRFPRCRGPRTVLPPHRERFHVRVIIYLRRQDQLKESIYAQVVREWFCGSILDENHYEYDHLKRLNLLRTQIPKQDLIVRRHVTSSGSRAGLSCYLWTCSGERL